MIDRNIIITLDKLDIYYFVLTGQDLPEDSNEAKYLLVKKEIEEENIRILLPNHSGKRKSKSC